VNERAQLLEHDELLGDFHAPQGEHVVGLVDLQVCLDVVHDRYQVVVLQHPRDVLPDFLLQIDLLARVPLLLDFQDVFDQVFDLDHLVAFHPVDAVVQKPEVCFVFEQFEDFDVFHEFPQVRVLDFVQESQDLGVVALDGLLPEVDDAEELREFVFVDLLVFDFAFGVEVVEVVDQVL